MAKQWITGIQARLALAISLILMVFASIGGQAESSEPKAANLSTPLSFEPNKGQTSDAVKFVSHGQGFVLFLTPDKAVFKLRNGKADASVLTMQLANANQGVQLSGLDQLPGKANYFLGNDSAKWQTGVSTYKKVAYRGLYSGIDAVFYGNQRQLEYDFNVAAGSNPSQIAFAFSGAEPKLDADGNLRMSLNGSEVMMHKPVIYQVAGSDRKMVEGSYRIADGRVSFNIGAYDHTKTLVVDPVITYMSYLGGSATDNIGATIGFGASGTQNPTQALGIDAAGNAYVVGTTLSTDFPVSNAIQPTRNVLDTRAGTVFVSKISADGSTLLYSTYLGGNDDDHGSAIAVDAAGNAYVVGTVHSQNFPVTAGAFQTLCGAFPFNGGRVSNCGTAANANGFVTKIAPDGSSLIYSTFLGGQSPGGLTAVAIDPQGRAYVVGNSAAYCNAGDPPFYCFPTTSDAVIPGTATSGHFNGMATLTVFNASGSNILYSTLYGDGGLNFDTFGETDGTAVTVDPSGNFYMAGTTRAQALVTTAGSFMPTAPRRIPIAFLAKFSPVGSPVTMTYSTYVAATDVSNDQGEYASGVQADSSGNAYLVGWTGSPSYPVTLGAYQTFCTPGGGANCASGFITKFNPTGSAIVWSTLVGDFTINGIGFNGPVNTFGNVQLDQNGNVYFAGQSNLGFPEVNPVEVSNGGAGQALVGKLDPTGSKMYFVALVGSGGSNGTQEAAGLAVDTKGSIYLAGNTNSGGLPTTPGSFQPQTTGCCSDGFVAKIDPFVSDTTDLSINPSTVNVGDSVSFQSMVHGAQGIIPTGTITFNNGATVLGTATLNASGVGTFTTSTLAAGTYTVTAVYSGDNTYASSISGAQTLKVNSVAVPPTAPTISPNPVAFGNQTVNTTASIGVTVTNTGVTPLVISSVTPAASAAFSQTNNCVTTLAQNASCTVTVKFAPTAATSQNATFTITDNAGSQTFQATGTGTAVVAPTAPTIAPNPVAFGSLTVNTNATIPVTITNTGTASLNITALAPASSGAFSQTNNCITTLAHNASCTVSVKFAPTATGAQSATFTLTDNAGSQTFQATGTGTAAATPKVTLSKTALTFASQNIGTTSAAQTFTITNSGNALLTFTNIAVSGDYVLSKDCGSSLAASSFCTVSVTFSPSATGTRTGAVTITDNAGTQSVALSGTGAVGAPKLSWASVGQGTVSAGVMYVDAQVTNIGTGIADNIKVTTVVLRTVTGTGTVALDASSVKPVISLPNLAVGATATVHFVIDVPAGVTRYTVTETGTVQDFVGTNYAYSGAEVITK